MKRTGLLFLFAVILCGMTIPAFGQIYGPEGVNMPGTYDSPTWSNPPTKPALQGIETPGGLFLLDNSLATAKYKTVIHVAAAGDFATGTYDFKVSSGPTSNYWANSWGKGGTMALNTVEPMYFGGGNSTLTFNDAKYYTVNFQDAGYVNSNMVVMETVAPPITFSAVTRSAAIYAGTPVTITITGSAAPSAGENVYVRYSTDAWATSTNVLATMTTTTGTAVIPGLAAGTVVSYYVYSTTATNPTSDWDLFTLNANNNAKANYSYTVASGLVLVDDFSYTPGTLLTANGWTAHSGGGTNAQKVTVAGLTYTGYPGSGIGYADTVVLTGEDDNRVWTNPVSSGSVYGAALVNLVATSTIGDYFFHFGVAPVSTSFYARMFVKKDPSSSNFAFGISKNNGTVSYTPYSYSLNTTYLVVIKYTFVAGSSNDVASLFVNPTLGAAEPSPIVTGGDNLTVGDGGNIGGVCIRQGTTANMPAGRIDGIRVGTTWADVTPLVQATTPTATTGAASAVTTASATLNGTVNPNNGLTTVTFNYGLTGAYGSSVAANESPLPVGASPVAVTAPISSLTSNTLYHYQVTGTNSAGTGTGSDATFTTLPDAPTVGSGTGMTSTSFTANWTAPSGTISGYKLDVATDNGFTTFVSGYNDLSVAGTSQLVSGLAGNSTYYFRVRAVGDGGTSASSSFATVVTAPDAPVAAAASGITTSSFTANWGVAAGATGYFLDVATDNGFTSFVTGYNNLAVAGTSQLVSGLLPNHTYYYQVRATDASGTSPNSNAITTVTSCPTITLTPVTLLNGQQGIAYNQTVTGNGGTGPYTFALTAGVLPQGLGLATNGDITGTPTTLESQTFTITATDADGCTGALAYTVAVTNCPALTLTPAVLPHAALGSAYSGSVSASGGTGPYGYFVTAGTLPTGVTLASTGAFSGTPTVAGAFPVTITTHDSGTGCEQQNAFTLVVCEPIVLGALSNPTVGSAYHDTVKVTTGGTGPYTYTQAGNFPAGLTLATDGSISGTPTAAAIDTFTVTVTDANGCTDTHEYILTVGCPTITLPASLPAGVVGTAYSQSVAASGGSVPYGYAVTVGSLPNGLTLNPTTGAITGTPTVGNTFNFTVTATDVYGCVGSQAYSVTMNCPAITVSPASLPNGTINVAYTQTITASGATAPYTFAVTVGTLPTGITLSTAGLLAGTPTVGGSFPITVTATDANGCLGTRAYTLTIASPGVFKAAAGADTMYWENPTTWVLESGISLTGVPGTRDQVILDHTYHTGKYYISTGSKMAADTVTQSRPDSCAQITIGYVGNPDSIIVLIPHKAPVLASTVGYNLLFGDGVAGNYDMIISEKGVVNDSKDNFARSVAYRTLNDSMQILHGGTWVHNTVGFNTMHRVLSRKFDGDYGTIVFDMDKSFGTFDISGGGNYYYPNVVLNNTHNAPTYYWFGTGATYIKGDLIVGPGAKDSMMLATDPFIVYGNIVNNGTLMSTTSRLVLAGTTQTVSGANPLQLNGGLVVLNNTTVNLQTDIHVTGDTVKTSGNYTYSWTATTSPTVTVPITGTINTGTSTLFMDGGTMIEGTNPVMGQVSATRTVGTFVTENFGGGGAQIQSVGIAPGATTVVRTTGTALSGNGNQSIKRYYDITPTTNSALGAKLVFTYAPTVAELNGITESDLTLYKSTNLGTSWTGANATQDLANHKLSVTPVNDFSRWTAGSKTNPLFISHTITVSKKEDVDGDINTTGDQTAKKWRLSLYNGYISDSTVVATQNLNSGVMPVTNLEAGTYIAVEADSLGWLNLGAVVNGVAKPNSGPQDTITVSGGVNATIAFVNQRSSSLSIAKFVDTDGDALTTGDQTARTWDIEVYKGSVAPANLLTSGNTALLTIPAIQGGTYIIAEADSGSSWVRLNGNKSRFDTITVSAGGAYADTFINFQPNFIRVRKYTDNDGQFGTAGDRVKKAWQLEVHQGTASGPIVGSGNVDSLYVPNLGDGTYVIVEADSTNWTHLGYVLNAVPVSGSTHAITVTLAAGQTTTVDFVNAPPVYAQMFRTFKPDSVGGSVDNKGKQGKFVLRKNVAVDFSTTLTAPARANTGLLLKASMVSTAVIKNAADSVIGGWTAAKGGTVTGIDTNAVITITGRGTSGKAIKIDYVWSHAVKPTTTKGTALVTSILRLPMPNRINVLNEVMAGAGFGSNGLVVGQIQSDVKNYGWFQTLKYTEVVKTLDEKGTFHSGLPRGFNTYTSGKPVLKQNKTLVPSKFNNVLLANMIGLKLSITASAMQKTPLGFGELIFDDGTGSANVLNGKMVKEIAAYGDSIMMPWLTDTLVKTKTLKVRHFTDSATYANLNNAVSMILNAFEGSVDTVKFGDTLQMKGVRPLLGVTFLRGNSSAVPARIVAGSVVIPQEPTEYALNQNYPNPFNPTTTISFDLPKDALVTLKIYNILGQEVATLLNRELLSGGSTQEMQFDARNLATGVYFYRMIAEGIDDNGMTTADVFTQTKKMMLIK
jgi:hypothetical protein